MFSEKLRENFFDISGYPDISKKEKKLSDCILPHSGSGVPFPPSIKGLKLISEKSYTLNTQSAGGSSREKPLRVILQNKVTENMTNDTPGIIIVDNIRFRLTGATITSGKQPAVPDTLDTSWTIWPYLTRADSPYWGYGGKGQTIGFTGVSNGSTLTQYFPSPFIYGAFPYNSPLYRGSYWMLIQPITDPKVRSLYIDGTITISCTFHEYIPEI